MEKNDTRTLQKIVETEGYAAARKEADRRGVLWFASAGDDPEAEGGLRPPTKRPTTSAGTPVAGLTTTNLTQ